MRYGPSGELESALSRAVENCARVERISLAANRHGGLTGLASSETTPLVMLVAILVLATAVMLGVGIQHPVVAILFAVVAAPGGGVVGVLQVRSNHRKR
jgi:hypothetical protein